MQWITISIPILWIRKQRLRELHTAREAGNNHSLKLISEPKLLTLKLPPLHLPLFKPFQCWKEARTSLVV